MISHLVYEKAISKTCFIRVLAAPKDNGKTAKVR